MQYNPFEKPIGSKLAPEDLQVLLGRVAEGYKVEYKSDFPKNEKIGHSIASLANTYGGWYIVGVETDQQHVANRIPGFSLKDHSDAVSKVREIAKTHIDPVPVLYPQVVDIGNDRGVLAAYIPDGQEPPFVTKDGRIYRRTHDSSDPIPENARHSVDRLIDQGRNVERRFEEFCRDERSFSKAEKGQGWINLFVSPYPLGTVDKMDMLSSECLESLITLSKTPRKVLSMAGEITANLPFNSGQMASGSVILRQVDPASTAFNSLTAQLFVDGRAKFFITLRYFPPLGEWRLSELESAASSQTLARSDISNISLLRFLDISQLWLVIVSLMGYYRAWLGETGWVSDLQVAVTARGIWRSVPFFDSDAWASHVQRFGLPVMGWDSIRMPDPIKKGILLDPQDDGADGVLCFLIGKAFGLTIEVYSSALIEAIRNAIKRTQLV